MEREYIYFRTGYSGGDNRDMTPTEARDRAQHLSKSDTATALAVAQEIDDPWFRAQALAWIGRFAEKNGYRDIIAAAQRASWDAKDIYAAVGAAAWWLRALIERGATDDVLAELPRLIDASQQIPNPVSRLDALYLVFQAVFDVEGARRQLLEALLAACASADSWRAGRCRSDVAVMLHPQHPEEAARVIEAMPEGRRKRQAIRRTTVGSEYDIAPRPFFW